MLENIVYYKEEVLMEHEVDLVEIDGEMIKVDKKISLFIQCLNDFGFTTSLSCEDNNGKIWINFPSMLVVQTLMQTLSADAKFEAGKGNFNTLFEYLQNAEWSLCWDEGGIISPYEDNFIGNGIINYSVSLRFPKEDFESVEYLLYQVLCPLEKEKAEVETSA